MKVTQEDGTVIGSRGCAFQNGFYVYSDSTLIRRFNFDEYGTSPFLRSCTTDALDERNR